MDSITPTRQTGIPAPKRLTDVEMSISDLSTTKSPDSTGSSALSSDQTTVIYIGGQPLPPPPLPPVSNDSGRSSDGDSIYEYSLPSIAFSPNPACNDRPVLRNWPQGFPRLPSLQKIDNETTLYPESTDGYSSSNFTPRTNRTSTISNVPGLKNTRSDGKSGFSVKMVVIICLLTATIICQIGINALLAWDNNTLRDKLDREIGKTSNCEFRCYEKIHKQQKKLEKACAQQISRKNKKLSEILLGE